MSTLQRLQQQAQRIPTPPGIRLDVTPGRMVFKVGALKLRFPGYTVTVAAPGKIPHVVRVRTSKSCSDVLRGIGIGILAATS